MKERVLSISIVVVVLAVAIYSIPILMENSSFERLQVGPYLVGYYHSDPPDHLSVTMSAQEILDANPQVHDITWATRNGDGTYRFRTLRRRGMIMDQNSVSPPRWLNGRYNIDNKGITPPILK